MRTAATGKSKLPREREKKPSLRHIMDYFSYFEWLFGLKSAPSTFHRAMDVIWSMVQLHFTIFYLSNSEIFLKSIKAHFRPSYTSWSNFAMLTSLSRKRRANSSPIPLNKFFLSCLVNNWQHQNTLHQLDSQLRAPSKYRNITELQLFLGLSHVFPRFVLNFAQSAASL